VAGKASTDIRSSVGVDKSVILILRSIFEVVIVVTKREMAEDSVNGNDVDLALPLSPIVNSGQYEHLCDFVIKVDEKAFKCHKLALAKSSEFFNNMFMHECQENRKNEMTIEDFDEDTVANFIAFLYQGKLYDEENDQEESLVISKMVKYSASLMVMADKYQVSELKAKCATNLLNSLTCDSAAEIWEAAELIQNQDLIGAVHEFVIKNWTNEKCAEIKDLIRRHPDLSFGLVNSFKIMSKDMTKKLQDQKKEIDGKDKKIASMNSKMTRIKEHLINLYRTNDRYRAREAQRQNAAAGAPNAAPAAAPAAAQQWRAAQWRAAAAAPAPAAAQQRAAAQRRAAAAAPAPVQVHVRRVVREVIEEAPEAPAVANANPPAEAAVPNAPGWLGELWGAIPRLQRIIGVGQQQDEQEGRGEPRRQEDRQEDRGRGGNRPVPRRQERAQPGNGAGQRVRPQVGQEGPAPRNHEIVHVDGGNGNPVVELPRLGERELQGRPIRLQVRRDLAERRQHREGGEEEARRNGRERRERSRSPQPPNP